MTLLYHGTGNNFDRFHDTPTFFTYDPEIAKVYAIHGYRPSANDPAMDVEQVLVVDVDLSNYKVMTRDEVFSKFGGVEEEDCSLWECLSNYTYELGRSGYEGLILRQMKDVTKIVDGEQTLAFYDQVIVYSPVDLAIQQRILL